MTSPNPLITDRPEGRDLNLRETARQIGTGNLLAVSGGRIGYLNASTAVLPVGAGYRVTVHLAANDTYTVTREYKRGGKVWDHGHETDVYCDQLSDSVYRASCYVNVEYGQEVAAA